MPGFEWIGKEEKEAVTSIFENGGVLFAHGFDGMRNGVFHVREFENECSRKFGVEHCLAVSSGTAAIKIALKALGVGHGDEVITQAFNFIATVEAILDCGAVPVIANVNQSLNLDPRELESLSTSRTKAIVPVHMLGVAAEMDVICEFARANNLLVVEDNCESVGALYDGQYLGTIGDLGAFSFDQGKVIATGEGGMVLSKNESFAKFAREYHDHGHENNPSFPRGMDTCTAPGFNYRMTEMQAAVGRAQLAKLDDMLEANRLRYEALSSSLGNVFPQRNIPEKAETIHDALIFFVQDASLREEVVQLLHGEGFGTKNLPDALKWHCTAYWKHALSEEQIERAKPTKDLLETAVAVPIWKRKTPQEYKELGSSLARISS